MKMEYTDRINIYIYIITTFKKMYIYIYMFLKNDEVIGNKRQETSDHAH